MDEGFLKKLLSLFFYSFFAFVFSFAVCADPETQFSATLFTDITGYTNLTSHIGDPEITHRLVERYVTITREALARHGGEMISAEGDGIVTQFNGNLLNPVKSALAVFYEVKIALAELEIIKERAVLRRGIEISGGLHVGIPSSIPAARELEKKALSGHVYVNGPARHSVFNEPFTVAEQEIDVYDFVLDNPSWLNFDPASITPRFQGSIENRDLSVIFVTWHGPQWNQVKTRAADIVTRLGGSIAKEIPGEVPTLMILVGAPKAFPNNPLQATKIALALRDFARDVGAATRCGIGHGKVTFERGGQGQGDSPQGDVFGDAVNMASRMGSASQDHEIVVSDIVYKEVRSDVLFDAAVTRHVKTYGERAIYRVTELKLTSSSWHTRDFIAGRKTEIDFFSDLLYRVSHDRKGDLVFYEGEAGIGKSHLLGMLRQTSAGATDSIFEARTNESGDNPLKEILRKLERNLNLSENWKTVFGEDGKIRYEALHWYQGNLPEGDNGVSLQEFTPQDRMRIVKSAISELLAYQARHKPTVCFIEDLHLTPPHERNFLFDIITAVKEEPILFCLSARPFESGDIPIEIPYGTKRNLSGLSLKETRNLMRSYLGEGEITPGLLNFIFDRSKGNPLFITALIDRLRSLNAMANSDIGWKVTKPEVLEGVPYTLRDLIQSRIDALPDDAKRLFQIISVITLGNDVDMTIVRKLSRHAMAERTMGGDLDLRNLEVIRREGLLSENHGDWQLDHILYKEVAYGNMPRALKADTHALVAVVLEQTYPEKQIVEGMIHHLRAAGQLGQLGRWLKLGIEQASEANQMERVVALSNEALGLTYLNSGERVKISLQLSKALAFLGERETALATAQSVLDVANDLEKVDLYIQIADIYRKQGSMTEAEFAADSAHTKAQECGDESAIMKAMKMRGIVATYRGENQKAKECYVFALNIAQRIGDKFVEADLEYDLGYLLTRHAKYEEARQHFEIAHRLEQALDRKLEIAKILDALATHTDETGKRTYDLEILKKVLNIYQAVGDLDGMALVNIKLGITYYNQSNWHLAEYHYLQAREALLKTRNILILIPVLEHLGELELERPNGSFDLAHEYFLKTQELISKLNDPEKSAGILIYFGLEQLKRNNPQGALEKFLEALPLARSVDRPITLGACYVNLAIACLGVGDRESAVMWGKEAETHFRRYPKAEHQEELKREVWTVVASEREAISTAELSPNSGAGDKSRIQQGGRRALEQTGLAREQTRAEHSAEALGNNGEGRVKQFLRSIRDRILPRGKR